MMESVTPWRFKRIYIEISNVCNLQCTFCPVVDRDKKILEVKNFENILTQVKPLADEICLHLMGEPLAHPEFSQIIELCDRYEIPVQLTTNGTLIESRSDILLAFASLRQINFSLQSYLDNYPQGDLLKYMNTIFSFAKKLEQKRDQVYLNYRLWNYQAGKENDNKKFFELIESFYQVKLNPRVQTENIKSKKIIGRHYMHFDSRFEWPSWNSPHYGEQGTCHALTQHFGIHADGTVVPCCLDKEAQIPLGNCLETSLIEILNSERAAKMKIGFAQKKLIEPFCQRCEFIQRFN
jgi:radical SAM protein with 4Fe4S-binding SPASM domain